ncbi:hypothetical protein PHAVU_007G036100 [Phaseolus vulgaris]|uniref:Uncharacterized protein n=1 Tax=Phaseolus vulgaris TaxID=3885 RepID=V7BEW5_PHAVU|nr:hypothetical protein PHAVU_007G036100g [Phaseolus vulgaris]ESW15006.1 hypothetical protein PHAVU_007G036100g [Phaseolus vulgaris]
MTVSFSVQEIWAELPLTPPSLRHLTVSAKIPTMLSSQPLTISPSSSDRLTSINNNNINLTQSSIYDHASLLLYHRFFDPNFQFNSQRPISSYSNSCSVKNHTASVFDSFNQAIQSLKTGGSSVVPAGITVFTINITLMNFDNRVCLVFFEGFTISITLSDGILLFNGVPVFFPFFNDRIVVDDVNDILASQRPAEERMIGISILTLNTDDKNISHYCKNYK